MTADLTVRLSENTLWFIAGFLAFPVVAFFILFLFALWEGDS